MLFHRDKLLTSDKPRGLSVNDTTSNELNTQFGNTSGRHDSPYAGCEYFKQLRIGRALGHGISKFAYLALDGRNKVIVKMVTNESTEYTECKENQGNDCHVLPTMKLMKEILFMQQLQHPNIVRLLAFCLRSEDIDNLSIHKHGVVAAVEYGDILSEYVMRKWSTEEKLQAALGLADMLDYLEKHSGGPYILLDFKLDNFRLFKGVIKITDLDWIESNQLEYCKKSPAPCGGNVPCVKVCVYWAAKCNMDDFYEKFSHILLDSSSEHINRHLKGIRYLMKESKLTAHELKGQLLQLLAM